MYRDIYTTIRPMLDSADEAAYVTAEVLDTYAMMSSACIADANATLLDDALEVFLDGSEPPFHMAVDAAVAIMRAAGLRDINEPIMDVPGTTLYLGGDTFLDAVEGVVPGRWSVLHTSEFSAVVCEEVLFDEDDGDWELSDHDASGFYGVFVDTTAAAEGFSTFGPAVTPDAMTVRSTYPRFRSAVHRRPDGRCDAIFLSETEN